MKRVLVTISLASMLSVSALAGEIPTVNLSSPAADEPTQTTTTTSPGDIPSVGYTNIALNLMQMMVGVVI